MGEGGWVEKGEAKKAFVLEFGGEEDTDVVDPISENMEDALDPEEWDLSEGRQSCITVQHRKIQKQVSVTQNISHSLGKILNK
jgi:hypothetical protein